MRKPSLDFFWTFFISPVHDKLFKHFYEYFKCNINVYINKNFMNVHGDSFIVLIFFVSIHSFLIFVFYKLNLLEDASLCVIRVGACRTKV